MSSRARFQPTLPAPAMITYMAAYPPVALPQAVNTTSDAWSIATWVGHTVTNPCSPYHAARAGSATRTTTRGTLKRRCAIWAITRLVLSPLVAATNTSASSIPASIKASTSSAVPTVNRPPASSQVVVWSLSRRSWDSGSLSSTDTSRPASSARLATAEPTRPHPTIRMNTAGNLARRPGVHASASDRSGDDRNDQQRDDVRDLDHPVDRRPGRALVWVADGGTGA